MSTHQKLMEVSDLSMRFGGPVSGQRRQAGRGQGEVISIIGPNGAGKTTVFNCLTGFYRPSGGIIRYKGEEIQGLPGHLIARKGIVRTFQHVRLFKDMTAVENLLVAQHRHLNTGFLAGLFKTPAFRRAERRGWSSPPSGWRRWGSGSANRAAGNLAYGQQRRLEIARCMATRPELLMLDEPAAGLNPHETDELNELISNLRDEFGVSVLLIEHDMKLVMEISNRIFVVNQGTPLAHGKPDEIRSNPAVIKAYLGES